MHPVVGAAVERIFEALHADLVAIVDARHAGIGHLPEGCHEEAARAEIELLRRHAHARLLDGGHPLIVGDAGEYGDRALYVMAADEVHHRIEIFLRVVLDLACEPSCCLASIDRAREEVEHHRAQRVVHC